MQDGIEPRAYRRRGEAFWRRAVEAQRESGSSQQEFCERNGLALSTFQRWRRRLGESGEGPPSEGSSEFMEGVVRPEGQARPGGSAPEGDGAAGFELSFESGVRLRLPRQVEGRALAEVLWALQVTDLC